MTVGEIILQQPVAELITLGLFLIDNKKNFTNLLTCQVNNIIIDPSSQSMTPRHEKHKNKTAQSAVLGPGDVSPTVLYFFINPLPNHHSIGGCCG